MVDSQGKSLDSAGGGDFIYEYAINYNWHGPGLLCLDNLYNFFLENHPYLCQWLGVIARLWSWSRDIDDTFLRYLEPDGKMPVPWLMIAAGLISELPMRWRDAFLGLGLDPFCPARGGFSALNATWSGTWSW